MQDDFYIGYHDRAPKKYADFLRRRLPWLLIILLAVSFILVKFQKGFTTATFELGRLTEVSGLLTLSPVPMLSIGESGEYILLIGYGKHGADGALADALGDDYNTGESYRVKLVGTLIYHDGKTLLELTKKKASVLSWEAAGKTNAAPASLGPLALRGEIIDPKCYFGVMKPGEGKPHRSCAIRCISGGIPPVMKVSDGAGQTNYFILKGSDGRSINDLVLDFVAEPVEVSGEGFQFHNWMILNLDESYGINPLL